MKPSIDKYNKEILIDNTGFQVMMEWEKEYMEALVNNLNPSGHVLEIGFGLGYSANRIQSFNIQSYTVIESDPDIIENILKWASNQNHSVRVVEGPWQEVLKYLGKFDSIFFDDSPHELFLDPSNIRLYKFYYEILKNHANIGCRMTAYMDYPNHWVSHPFTTWENKIFKIKAPDNCDYIKEIKKDFMCMPLITFPLGTIPNALSIYVDNDLNIIKD
jgi:hypothetical protein